jgi:hypothetical protein
MTDEKKFYHLCPFCEGPLVAEVEWYPHAGAPEGDAVVLWTPPHNKSYPESQVELGERGFTHDPAEGPGGDGHIQLIVCSDCCNHLPPSYYTHGHRLPPLPWEVFDTAHEFQGFVVNFGDWIKIESAQIDLRASHYIQHAVNIYPSMLKLIDAMLDEMQLDMSEGIGYPDDPEYKEAMRIRELCARVEGPVSEREREE